MSSTISSVSCGAGDRLDAGGQLGADAIPQLGVAHARLGAHDDRADLARSPGDLALRAGEGERGEGGLTQPVRVAEGRDPDDLHAQRLRALERRDVAELQVAGRRRTLVDDDLVAGRGARPSTSRYGFSSGSVIQLPARRGGPLPPMASPSRPRSDP